MSTGGAPSGWGSKRNIPVVHGRVQGRWRGSDSYLPQPASLHIRGGQMSTYQSAAPHARNSLSGSSMPSWAGQGNLPQSGFAAAGSQATLPSASLQSVPAMGAHPPASAAGSIVGPGAAGVQNAGPHAYAAYPDSTRLPARPTLTAVNAASGAHVVTSGLRTNVTAGQATQHHHASRLPAAGAGAAAGRETLAGTKAAMYGAYYGHGAGQAGAQSRFLVGTRGYTRTSAWPGRQVAQAPAMSVSAATVDLEALGVSSEVLDAVSTRMLTHWDLAGQYTHDGLCTYLRKVCVRMELDLLCVLTAMLYTERLRAKFPDAGKSSCAKRVLTMGLLTASKYHKDHPFDNTSWARFCDIPLLTLNGMERQFLEALQFELFLAPSHMEGLLDSLETEQGVSLHELAQDIFDVLTPRPASPANSRGSPVMTGNCGSQTPALPASNVAAETAVAMETDAQEHAPASNVAADIASTLGSGANERSPTGDAPSTRLTPPMPTTRQPGNGRRSAAEQFKENIAMGVDQDVGAAPRLASPRPRSARPHALRLPFSGGNSPKVNLGSSTGVMLPKQLALAMGVQYADGGDGFWSESAKLTNRHIWQHFVDGNNIVSPSF